jgi:hypothetical protein
VQSRTRQEITVQSRTWQEMSVRAGLGKKYRAEKDKTRNDSQNRTWQEITVRAGKARNHRQRRTRQSIVLGEGQGIK